MFEIAEQIPTAPSAPIPTGAPSTPLTTDGDFEYGVDDIHYILIILLKITYLYKNWNWIQ